MKGEPAWLRVEEVLAIHDRLLADFGGGAGLRDLGILESALASPRNHFAYGERDIVPLASAYACAITMAHPFVDGNKRTGFLACAVFLEANAFRLTASQEEVVSAMVGLAEKKLSPAAFTEWLRRNCVRIRGERAPVRKRRAKPKRLRRHGRGG